MGEGRRRETERTRDLPGAFERNINKEQGAHCLLHELTNQRLPPSFNKGVPLFFA